MAQKHIALSFLLFLSLATVGPTVLSMVSPSFSIVQVIDLQEEEDGQKTSQSLSLNEIEEEFVYPFIRSVFRHTVEKSQKLTIFQDILSQFVMEFITPPPDRI